MQLTNGGVYILLYVTNIPSYERFRATSVLTFGAGDSLQYLTRKIPFQLSNYRCLMYAGTAVRV